jgi:cell division protein FtsW
MKLMVSRVERGPVADWMRTADRWLIGSFIALMVIGLVMALAASPAVAERLNLSTFHFVNRQALMLIPTAALMIATSFLSPRHVRRAALLTFVVSFALVILALMFGPEVKGARRWIFGLQPSEFIKPAFVVLAAWAFTEGGRTGPTAIPAKLLSFLLLPIAIVPLIFEPDFGQTMLVAVVWTALFFLAGLHWFWVVAVGGMGMAGGFTVFKLSPHVHERVLRFLDPDSTGGLVDTFQVDTALQSILSGGWLGRGPGEGVYKRILPDAHTDFVFAVTGEEFGMIACMALIAFFAFIVLRALFLAARNPDPFCRLAAAGLTVMFAVQSWINMAVNLRAMPAKGMTLPFISYGGSSLLALGLGMGFLIATTRKRPAADLEHPAATEG